MQYIGKKTETDLRGNFDFIFMLSLSLVVLLRILKKVKFFFKDHTLIIFVRVSIICSLQVYNLINEEY